MAKKSRLSKDAFDWVKDTSGEASEETSPPEKTKAPKKAKKSTASKTSASKPKKPSPAEKPEVKDTAARTVFIRYKTGGDILMVAEIVKEGYKAGEHPFGKLAKNEKAAEFKLTGELAKLNLGTIQRRYRVEASGTAPKLVLKK